MSMNSFRLPEPGYPMKWMKQEGFYFSEKPIEALRGSRVVVQGHGEMIMLASYSYLVGISHFRGRITPHHH
jgi:hypothetical protein